MREALKKKENISAVVLLGIFTFVYLGMEYMFVNMMGVFVSENKTVNAQNYALGFSAAGFFLYPVLQKMIKKRQRQPSVYLLSLLLVICIFTVWQHVCEMLTFAAGMLLFFLLGILGSMVHYLFFCFCGTGKYLARMVGIAYALGILLQFVNNNLIDAELLEALFLSLTLLPLTIIAVRLEERLSEPEEPHEEQEGTDRQRVMRGAVFFLLIALMACVFSTLDNTVTIRHVEGIDIGRWPRVLLACSGLVAGCVFDIQKRKYMHLIMYCIMLLSTACVAVVMLGGSFLIGLIVFYLSAGFFTVYFTAGFMELAENMKDPRAWAGMGRVANNVSAFVMTDASVRLVSSGNVMMVIILALFFFAAVSVMVTVYMMMRRKEKECLRKQIKYMEETQKFDEFARIFLLTEKEREVLQCLLASDDNIQDIAGRLAISRAALYRHIASLNEKTGTKTRIGLMQYYYVWDSEKETFS